MKKINLFLTAAAAALGIAASAAPASAAVVNLSGVGVATSNVQAAPVDQISGAVNVSFGGIVGSNVDNSALNANNLVSDKIDVSQDALGLNGSIAAVGSTNLSFAPVDQVAISANLGGGLLSSNVTNSATNLNNTGIASITVKQQ